MKLISELILLTELSLVCFQCFLSFHTNYKFEKKQNLIMERDYICFSYVQVLSQSHSFTNMSSMTYKSNVSQSLCLPDQKLQSIIFILRHLE